MHLVLDAEKHYTVQANNDTLTNKIARPIMIITMEIVPLIKHYCKVFFEATKIVQLKVSANGAYDQNILTVKRHAY